MSGVIDDKGIQWEHCNVCGKWVRLDDLGLDPTDTHHKGGCDICLECVNKHPNIEAIQPAKAWVPQYEELDDEDSDQEETDAEVIDDALMESHCE